MKFIFVGKPLTDLGIRRRQPSLTFIDLQRLLTSSVKVFILQTMQTRSTELKTLNSERRVIVADAKAVKIVGKSV